MTHLTEDQLILHYYGEDAGDVLVEPHLTDCAECRADYNLLRLVLNTVNSATVPERGLDYGGSVWRRIESKVGRKQRFSFGLERWWVLVPTVAMLMLVAFFVGRWSHPIGPAGPVAATQVRERILLVAVGDHLDRSQMVLAELSNAPDGKGKIDISNEQRLAEDLLDDNRLYRQTARSTGDAAVAGVLDDLERMLLDIAHSPSEISAQQLDQLRQEIRDRGLVFKVRVAGSQIRQRENAPAHLPEKDSKNL